VAASKTDKLEKELLTEKKGNRALKFFQWLAKGYESSPPCHS
jgi:hypothetical protein